MRRWAFLLAVVAVVVGLVVYAESKGGSASQAVQYRHYFDEGKRMCRGFDAGLKPTPLPGVTVVWTSGIIGPIILKMPNIPAKYRSAVTAGCNAAA